MKKIFPLFFLLILSVSINAKKNDLVGYDYELVSAKGISGASVGFRVFKVWSYCKKREMLTQEICMRNAVHGILFKGLAGTDDQGGGFNALCPGGYETNPEYFDDFFNSGTFKQFIQLTSKGAQQAGDVVKLANKRWKVGLVVQVNVKTLRKRLEQDGIILSTTDIFRR